MSHEPERIEWTDDMARLAELAPAWDRLAAAADPTPFSDAEWLGCWWDAFGADARPEIALAWRGERLVAGLALARRGRRLEAMANVHSPLFRPVAADDDARSAVVEAALRAAGGGLELPAVPADDPLVLNEGGRWRRTTAPAAVSLIVDTAGDLAEWRAGSKPRWGAPLERFRRKMAREHDARFALVQAPGDLEEELAQGLAVEASGWKGRAGTAIVSSSETERFYRGVARTFATGGELVTSSLLLDGALAAWDLCLLRHGRLYLLKTGFDERHRRLAPGLVLRLSVIERCFEMGLLAHDLLGDVDDWKPKFATSSRAHVDWTGYLRDAPATLRYVGRVGSRRAMGAARRVRRHAERVRRPSADQRAS